MSIHMRRQIDKIKKAVLTMGGLVEQQFRDAIQAVEQRDPSFADKVDANEKRINQMENDIEEECLATLALHQPVAFDLRYVISMLKMGNDLERVGDMAHKIATQGRFLASEEPLDNLPYDVSATANVAASMLKRSLDALVNVDTALASSVLEDDDQIDRVHRQMCEQVEGFIRENPHQISQYLHLLHIVRHLERIGDKAGNIAKDVLYMADGDLHKQNGNGHAKSNPASARSA